MSHDFILSITGAHVRNAQEQLGNMYEVEKYLKDDINYNNQEEGIFYSNVCHGILFLYSLTAALDSIVVFVAKKKGCKKSSYGERVKFLQAKRIISVDKKTLSKCRELRKTRNLVTHWEKNLSRTLGSMNYLPYMFGNVEPKSKYELLISRLNKLKLEQYWDAYSALLDNIINNEEPQDNQLVALFLKTVQQGNIVFEDCGFIKSYN